jgi:putative acetyltransferase
VGKFRSKLSGQLTLVATLEGSPVGFASLEGKDRIDMLYVHPARTGQGVGAMLTDALEKLAGARGFFEKRGYVAQQRNSISIGDEWLANTTLQKQLIVKREVS